jgi:hypothetical protein
VRVATLRADFAIPSADSLKDKRRVVRSLRDRIRARYPVAVAEVADQDVWRRAVLGVAAVGAEGGPIESTLDEIQRMVASDTRIVVIEFVRDSF